MNEFITLCDVTKSYRMGEVDVCAANGVSFAIEQGDFAVVVGASGAGKTTVLNLLGGMDKCTSGKIQVDGAVVSDMKRKELTYYRRYDIGFVFQFYNLVQNLTALENVELATQISKDPLPAQEVLSLVGLGGMTDHFPAQLSGGEQQRVAIARALAKNPKLLLCDEPTGALDSSTGKAVLQLLQDTCKKSGMTVVLITHNKAIAPMADIVITMKNGKVAGCVRNATPSLIEAIEW